MALVKLADTAGSWSLHNLVCWLKEPTAPSCLPWLSTLIGLCGAKIDDKEAFFVTFTKSAYLTLYHKWRIMLFLTIAFVTSSPSLRWYLVQRHDFFQWRTFNITSLCIFDIAAVCLLSKASPLYFLKWSSQDRTAIHLPLHTTQTRC